MGYGLRELAAGVPCVGAVIGVVRVDIHGLGAVVVVNVLIGLATVVRHGNGIVAGELALLIEHLYHVDVVVLVVLLVVLDGTPVYYELGRMLTVRNIVVCAVTVGCDGDDAGRCTRNLGRRNLIRIGDELVLIGSCGVAGIVEGEEGVARLTCLHVDSLNRYTTNVVVHADRGTAIGAVLDYGVGLFEYEANVVCAGVAVGDTQLHLTRGHIQAFLVEGYHADNALKVASVRSVEGIGALTLHNHLKGGQRGDIVQSGELGYGHRG